MLNILIKIKIRCWHPPRCSLVPLGGRPSPFLLWGGGGEWCWKWQWWRAIHNQHWYHMIPNENIRTWRMRIEEWSGLLWRALRDEPVSDSLRRKARYQVILSIQSKMPQKDVAKLLMMITWQATIWRCRERRQLAWLALGRFPRKSSN